MKRWLACMLAAVLLLSVSLMPVAAAGHKTAPDTPGAATSQADSEDAVLKVRVNGTWYTTSLTGYKGQSDVWVPVSVDIAGLNGNAENYFGVSSNVINHGNFTDSSVDIYTTMTGENLQSFLTNDQYSDNGWMPYGDRNINIKLQLFNGSEWVTVTPIEDAYFDEHTVVGLFSDNNTYYNFARNMIVDSVEGYTDARVLVHLHVGTYLDTGASGAGPYTIIATATEGGTVSGQPEAPVAAGTEVTLTAAPEGEYFFLGWYEGETKLSESLVYTFSASKNMTLEARFDPDSDGHKHTPDTPGEAVSTANHYLAAVKVRVNGSWYGAYLSEFKGQNDVWVPVYIPLEKLNANAENYFQVSSNVINNGNFTDSSLDLYATRTTEGLQSFVTNHQWCDEGWAAFGDRNINMKVQVYDGEQWVTLAGNETACYDEHTVVGKFAEDGNWYNFARNMTIGDLPSYGTCRVLLHMNVGNNLEIPGNYVEEEFATFLGIAENPNTGDSTPLVLLTVLTVVGLAGAVLLLSKKKHI